ncbi:hypothetical protein WA026_002397 [Henosepilachna vigintioctopunctata]|uniref:Uncharacterized protein n=1 Tax=Henosepilachna vigintioctopunctata TaxID=420089 RepID=A0AAW1U091_9CUCU
MHGTNHGENCVSKVLNEDEQIFIEPINETMLLAITDSSSSFPLRAGFPVSNTIIIVSSSESVLCNCYKYSDPIIRVPHISRPIINARARIVILIILGASEHILQQVRGALGYNQEAPEGTRSMQFPLAPSTMTPYYTVDIYPNPERSAMQNQLPNPD